MAQSPNTPLLSQPDTPALSLGTCGFLVEEVWALITGGHFHGQGSPSKLVTLDLVNIKQIPNFCGGLHRGPRDQNTHCVQDTMTRSIKAP